MKWADKRRLLVGSLLALAAARAVWVVCNACGRALANDASRHASAIRLDRAKPIVWPIGTEQTRRGDWIVLPLRPRRSMADHGLGKWL